MKRNGKKNPQEHVLLSAAKHPFVWSGLGLLFRGGAFGPFSNLSLGAVSLAYGLWDLSRKRKSGLDLPTSILEFQPSDAVEFIDANVKLPNEED